MRKRYGKFLLALVLALTLLMAGCGSQTPDTPVTPVNPGTEQTDPQDKPETPDTPDTHDEPDTPDTSEPSGQDQYHTDPVPQGKPQPVEPEETKPDTSQQATCTISISCATILDNMDKCDESKRALIPADGTILSASTVTFSPGESVFDVLQRVCRERKIPMEFSFTPIYNSAYIEGIYNLYEFDVGDGSGWMYKVNDWFPNYGCSRYQVQQGDVICWVYTCDLGYDVGGGYAAGYGPENRKNPQGGACAPRPAQNRMTKGGRSRGRRLFPLSSPGEFPFFRPGAGLFHGADAPGVPGGVPDGGAGVRR